MFGSRRPDSKAFHELLDAMRAYEKKFLKRRFLKTDTEFADGYRNMLDLLSTGMDLYVHNSPERPRFIPLASPIRKLGGDNADALYYVAPISPGRTYRVTGTAGGAVYLGFTVYGAEDPQKFHIVSNLSTPAVEVDEEGRFEILITADPEVSGGNVLRSDGSADCVLIRRYYLDKEGMRDDPGVQEIEMFEDAGIPADNSGEEMERVLRRLTAFLKGWFDLTPLPMPPISLAYNRLSKPKRASADTGHWSTPDNIHSFGFFRVKEGERLFIRGRSVECLYWSMHLWNPYMQTFDYLNHPCAANSSEVELDADGGWELCISHDDPGHPNWVSTTGRGRGFMYFRWLKTERLPDKPEVFLQKAK